MTHSLEARLRDATGLQLVRVTDVGADEHRAAAIGRAVARFIEELIGSPCDIACGWGRTMRLVAAAALPREARGVTFLDIVGRTPWWGAGEEAFYLSDSLASRYGAQVRALDAPAFASTREHAKRLLSSASVSETLDRASHAAAVVVSPGTADPETSSVVLTGGATPADLRAVRERGAVGDIVGHFYDVAGRRLLYPPSDERAIRLTWEQLRSAHVVCLGVGADKVSAVIGAARAGLIKGLITDGAAAAELLASLEAGHGAADSTSSRGGT